LTSSINIVRIVLSIAHALSNHLGKVFLWGLLTKAILLILMSGTMLIPLILLDKRDDAKRNGTNDQGPDKDAADNQTGIWVFLFLGMTSREESKEEDK
jgi:hypothetical protein